MTIAHHRVDSRQNSLALGASYVARSEVTGGMPVYLVLESTSICNLTCVMCPYPTMGRTNQHMSMTLYEKIIREASASVQFIWLHLFGEPLLNPNIYRMIDMAEEAGIRTGLSTNATPLTGKSAISLLESRLSLLLLCMDGATRETYESIRVGASYDAVTRNIERFAQLRRGHPTGLKSVLQMIDMTLNRGEEEAFRARWRDAGLDAILFKPFHVWANQDTVLTQFGLPQLPLRRGACYEPWIGFTILADGTAVPCCNDYSGQQPLGDLNTETIGEIWNGSEMKKLRRMLGDERSDRCGTICDKCPFPSASDDSASAGGGPFDPVLFQIGSYARSV